MNKKNAKKTANLIIDLILKLDDKNLMCLYDVIEKELKKRGVEDVRGCMLFLD